jgi:hypothetical protein
MIQAGGEILPSEIHKLINSVWNKEELFDHWKEAIILQIYKKSDNIDCSNRIYHELSLISTSYKFYPVPFSQPITVAAWSKA